MDDGNQPLILIILLLMGSFYISLSETAIASASKMRLKAAAERGDKRAVNALFLLDNFDKAITSLLIYNNIINLSYASIVTVFVSRTWGLSYVTLSTIIATIVLFFAGEMIPKSIAKKRSEDILIACAGSLKLLMKIITPLAMILAAIGELAGRLAKTETEITVTEDELYDIIENMEEEGAIDEEQSDLFSSALKFSDITIDSIMTPRVDMVAIDVDDDIANIVSLIKNTNRSRIPVYQKTQDNIIGILMAKKFLKAYVENRELKDIRPLLDKAYFTVSSIAIDELLEKMTQLKESMAIISDNHGGTLGLVTVEDILEELVGEIWDEDDKIEEPIVLLNENECLCDGEEIVGDVLDELKANCASEEDEAEFENMLVAEWIYSHFSEIPRVNDTFVYNNIEVTIEKMAKNRIVQARFKKLGKEEA